MIGTTLLEKTLVAFSVHSMANTQKEVTIGEPSAKLPKYALCVENPSTESDLSVKVMNVLNGADYFAETIVIPKSASVTGTTVSKYIKPITSLFFGDGAPKLIVSNNTGVTVASVAASAEIGEGANGVITLTANTNGVAGNSITVAATAGSAAADLSAAFNTPNLVVTLGMTAGVKASTTLGAGADGVVTITADSIGTAGNSFTVEVVAGTGANTNMSAALNSSAITVTLGTDAAEALDPAKNTAALIAVAVAALTGVTATHSGTGATPIAGAVAVKNLVGGLAAALDAAKNTAALIVAAVNGVTDIPITASYSGTGVTALGAAVLETALEGGVDQVGTFTAANVYVSVVEVL